MQEMNAKCTFKQCRCLYFLLGDNIDGTYLCTSCRHIDDYHEFTSCTTPLVNTPNLKYPVFNPTNHLFASISQLDCTTTPSIFCTPTAPVRIPLIYGIIHNEVLLGTPANRNNNDLDKEIRCAIRRGNILSHSLKVRFYLHKKIHEKRHKLSKRVLKERLRNNEWCFDLEFSNDNHE